MENTINAINNLFNIYREKDKFYPIYLVSFNKDIFKKVVEINHATSEDGLDTVIYNETEIKRQCFALPEYVKIQAEDINDGSLITCISGIIQARYRQEIS